MDVSRRNDAILQFLEGTRLQPRALRSRLKQVTDPEYWRELNPDLPVCADYLPARVEKIPMTSAARRRNLEQFETLGFWQTTSFLSPVLIRRMRLCIERLAQQDWPAPFAFVYDAFWLVPRAPSIARLLNAILGWNYRQTSRVWCHYRSPLREDAGWGPRISNAAGLKQVSLFIPLTNTTLDNGCLYVIPRGRIPDDWIEQWSAAKQIGANDVAVLLRNSRSLPAEAGSVIGFDSNLIHGGTAVFQAQEPRMGFTVEFMAGPSRVSPMDTGPLPTLDARLQWIGQGILSHRDIELGMFRFSGMAERLNKDFSQ